jgi:hypothetical protein
VLVSSVFKDSKTTIAIVLPDLSMWLSGITRDRLNETDYLVVTNIVDNFPKRTEKVIILVLPDKNI